MEVIVSVAGSSLTDAKIMAERQLQQDLSAYEAEHDRVKFDQTTLDMQYKAPFADHEKRRAASQNVNCRANKTAVEGVGKNH